MTRMSGRFCAASGATFIARGYSHGLEFLKKLFKEAILHKGFSSIDVLQVCVTFYNMYEYYSKKVYELKGHNPQEYSEALKKIREEEERNPFMKKRRIAEGIYWMGVQTYSCRKI